MLAAIILAAGNSTRFKHSDSKLFTTINNKTLLEIIIDRFLNIKAIKQIVVTTNNHNDFNAIKSKYHSRITFITGGTTRQDSVKLALDTLNTTKYNKVLIHDAARCNCSEGLINNIITKLEHHKAVVPIIPMVDTVKKIDHQKELVTETIDRTNLGIVQTPQGFDLNAIKDLHHKHKNAAATDDAALFEIAGLKVAYVRGERTNFKITETEDYELAKRLFENPQYIHTNGYDLHKFDSEIKDCFIKLGGIEVPHNRKLIAHSDGDVLLHSLTDSVLGLTGSTDIGELFPDNLDENKNRDSIDFINKAIKIATANHIEISHIDITVILEKPKLSPFKEQIQNNIAKIFAIKKNQVNIKATTNEKVGDIGNGSAIAVLTTVTGKKYDR